MPRVAKEMSALEVRRLKHPAGVTRPASFAVGGVMARAFAEDSEDGWPEDLEATTIEGAVSEREWLLECVDEIAH